MNTLERIVNTINFEPHDRVPVIPPIFGHSAILSGVPLIKYLSDGGVLAKCQVKAHNHYGYDSVCAFMDVCVESEAVGSELEFRENLYPIVKSYIISNSSIINDLDLPDPFEDGRMPELLKAIGLLKEEIGDNALIVGCVLGPMTVAIQLMGIENVLFLSVDEPKKFTRLLDFATEVCKSFGKAQIESGVHVSLVFDPAASPIVIPPEMFRTHLIQRLKKIFEELKKAGSIVNWLFITGIAQRIFQYYPDIGVELAHFDYEVDPKDVRTTLPRTCLSGNLKPISFIEDRPEEIAKASSKLISNFREDEGYILSAGCEIPLESKPENIAAMVTAVHKRGIYD